MQNKKFFEVPYLPAEMLVPVSVVRARGETSEDGKRILSLYIERDLNYPIRSFTLWYRLSDLPIETYDNAHPYMKLEYNKPVMNEQSKLIFKQIIPEGTAVTGCCAFVSDVALEEGGVITYKQSDYIEAGTESISVPDGKMNIEKKKKTSKIRAIVASSIVAGILLLSGTGLFILEKSVDATADKLVSEQRFNEAYKIVSETMFKNVLQNVCEDAVDYYLSCEDYDNAFVYAKAAPDPFEDEVIEKLSLILLEQERYSELYLFLEGSAYKDVFQKICESASDKYLEKKDYENAYFYADAAPEPFSSKVIGAAKKALITNEGINIDALDVVREIKSSDDFDNAMLSLIDSCKKSHDYSNALIFSEEIRSFNERNGLASKIFIEGMEYFISNGEFKSAVSLIAQYGYNENDAKKILDYCKEVVDLQKLIDDSIASGDSVGAIILSNYLGVETKDITIKAEDEGVRKNLDSVYFLLSTQQKRAYHAQKFAVGKDAHYIGSGTVSGANAENAIAVASGEHQTVLLMKDGMVTPVSNAGHNLVLPIPASGNTVQVAVGHSHMVLLEADGTVKAFGSNTYNQCETGEWSDIVAVSAGADFTLGLKANGQLVACGSNRSGQCDVEGYRNVIDIDACDQTAVILFSDGSMSVQGDISMGLHKVKSFENVVKMRAGTACVVAQTADGQFLLADGTVTGSSGSVDGWQDVLDFDAGSLCIAYVNSNGNVVISGDGKPKK